MQQAQEESLFCSICPDQDRSQKNIFQCRNGHGICSGCSFNLKAKKVCPQCRVGFEEYNVRNGTGKGLIARMQFRKGKHTGCTTKTLREGLAAHFASCRFSPVGICKLFGKH